MGTKDQDKPKDGKGTGATRIPLDRPDPDKFDAYDFGQGQGKYGKIESDPKHVKDVAEYQAWRQKRDAEPDGDEDGKDTDGDGDSA